MVIKQSLRSGRPRRSLWLGNLWAKMLFTKRTDAVSVLLVTDYADINPNFLRGCWPRKLNEYVVCGSYSAAVFFVMVVQ